MTSLDCLFLYLSSLSSPVNILGTLVETQAWSVDALTNPLASSLYVKVLVAAMGTAMGTAPSGRFSGHFLPISIEPFDDGTLDRIYGSIVQWHFSRHADATIQRLARVSHVEE